MVDKTSLTWLRAVRRRKETGRRRLYYPAVMIRAASQGGRQDVIEIAIDRQVLADIGMNAGDRIGFAIDPDDQSRLYITQADEGLGYVIGRSGRYATRITISGRRATAIWHMIGEYPAVQDAGDGIYYVQKTESAEGQQ